MLKTSAERLAFKRKIQTELTEHCGAPWKEVWCEAHPQFNEMVFSILLYEDSDLKEAHKVFCHILARHVDAMRPLQAHVAYDKFTDSDLFYLGSVGGDRRGGNEAVFAALENDDLGRFGPLTTDGTGGYRSTDSKR